MPVAPKAGGSALMQLALSCESPQVGVGAFEFAAWRAYSHPSTLQGSCSGTLCQRTASTREMTEPMVLGLIPKLPSISSLLFMLHVSQQREGHEIFPSAALRPRLGRRGLLAHCWIQPRSPEDPGSRSWNSISQCSKSTQNILHCRR